MNQHWTIWAAILMVLTRHCLKVAEILVCLAAGKADETIYRTAVELALGLVVHGFGLIVAVLALIHISGGRL